MAGMDWFRWHHGSVTDPKFALVARKAGASLPDVLAVWAYILEAASQSENRGDFGEIDAEALDCLFGFPDTETRTANILQAMEDRGLTAGSRIAAWEKRQPKREREDSASAERQAASRAKQNHVTPSNAKQNHVTPSNASDSQKTPREEKRREEYSVTDVTGGEPPDQSALTKAELWAAGKSLLAEQNMPAKQCGSFVGKLVKDYGEAVVIEAVRATVVRRPADAAEFLVATCQTMARQRKKSEPEWRTEQRERTQIAAPGVAVGGQQADDFFIDAEVKRVTTNALG